MPVNVFSDSSFVIGVLEKGHYCAKHHCMSYAIRRMVHLAGQAVKWHHIRSHVGIALNEETDALASEGEAFSSKGSLTLRAHVPRGTVGAQVDTLCRCVTVYNYSENILRVQAAKTWQTR